MRSRFCARAGVLRSGTALSIRPGRGVRLPARIVNGLDHAEFVEEFDFGAITQGQDFLLLELQKGFRARHLGRCMPGGEAARASIDRKPLAEYLAAKLKDGANPPAPVRRRRVTPMPPRPEPGMVLLEKIVAGGKWGGLIGGIELRAAAPAAAALPADRVAVAPLHVGGWRRAMALTVWQNRARASWSRCRSACGTSPGTPRRPTTSRRSPPTSMMPAEAQLRPPRLGAPPPIGVNP